MFLKKIYHIVYVILVLKIKKKKIKHINKLLFVKEGQWLELFNESMKNRKYALIKKNTGVRTIEGEQTFFLNVAIILIYL